MAQTSVDSYIDQIAATLALGGSFKLWSDSDYPENLAEWEGRPPVLFFKGDLSRLGRRSLALVGRVDPSETGVAAADRFARKCVDNEITVVSGLARGIDGASHRASLRPPEGYTYAVLGHGLDHMYPRENADLYSTIPDNGAVITQFPTGMGPQRWTFPARNEVMCTLALGTVIVEGRSGCGSIIQADFSFKHGRPVFILGKNLKSNDAEWARTLVERGAHVIEHFDQVLDVVANSMKGASREQHGGEQESLFGDGSVALNEKGSGPSNRLARAVLFDLDGVVIDSRQATAEALASVASRALGRPVSPHEVDARGAPHKALQALGVADAYNVYKQNYDAAFEQASGSVAVFEKVAAGIRDLRAAGARVAAVTAQPLRRARSMLRPDIAELFEFVLTFNDTRGKKDVGITAALSRLSVEPHAAMYIGDQSKDLEAARKAGVKGVGVLWGFSEESELSRWPHDLLLIDESQISVRLLDILT